MFLFFTHTRQTKSKSESIRMKWQRLRKKGPKRQAERKRHIIQKKWQLHYMKRRRITKIFVHFIFFALSQSMGEISCTPLVFSYCQFQRQRVREKCQFIYCAASDATAVCYCRSAVFFLFSFLFLLAQPFNNQITLVRGCQFSWQSQIDGTLLMN